MAWVIPSLLAADFANLESGIRLMEKAGARMLHLDVMDGHFVPNLTLGPPVIKAVRRVTDLILDVHLMISNAEATFETYIAAGADYLTVHYEAVTHLNRLLAAIGEMGGKPGVVLNPHTPVGVLEEVLPLCHHVLLMSVNPGFGGQQFIPASYEKARKLKAMIRSQGQDVQIEIDGGVGPENTLQTVQSGVDLVVAGSAIFGSERPIEAFGKMQQIADQAGVD